MDKKTNNYAFIDSQNLNLGVQSLGWRLDYQRFRVYLKEKYKVGIAYIFIGYIPKNQSLYDNLQKAGYVLKFKPVLPNRYGEHKGNVDADLVLQTAVDFYENKFDRAVIITNDGDFYSLVDFLYQHVRLEAVISPCRKTCAILLRQAAKDKIDFVENLRHKLEYKKKSTV